MARVSYSESAAIPDILDAVAFNLIFGTLPNTGNTEHLTVKCQSVSIPGFSNEKFDVTLHGNTHSFRGRKMYPKTLTCQFVEDSTFATQNALRAWHEYIAGTESNNSQGYKADYAVDASLVVYDTTGVVAATHKLTAVFPNDVSDVNLSGESSAAMIVSATFSYDRFIPNTPIL